MKSQNLFKVVQSNLLEALADQLTQHLFPKQESHSLPFAFRKRLILVPHPSMKGWLTLFIAQKFGIATGFEISYLYEGISFLRNYLLLNFNQQKNLQLPYLPSQFDLKLMLEVEIKNIIENVSKFSEGEHSIWDPLLSYLKCESNQFSSAKVVSRLSSLCDQLSGLFLQYGTHAYSMIQEWENTSSIHWQQQLWKLIFGKESSYECSYLARELNELECRLENRKNKEEFEIHLFGFSYIPPLYYRFFQSLTNIYPVYYYQTSACQFFWSDLSSDKEAVFLQKLWQKKKITCSQQASLDSALQHRQPLLSNWGKIGKWALTMHEEYSHHSLESYYFPESIKKLNSSLYNDFLSNDTLYYKDQDFTLLKALQSDLLIMRSPVEVSRINFQYDDSIQIHEGSSKLREIEILYDQILRLLDKHCEYLNLNDFAVFAPDIHIYEPYIQGVFGNSSSQLKFNINGVKKVQEKNLINGFLQLIHLPFSRWDINSIVNLFTCPFFHKRQNLSESDVKLIQSWLKLGGFKWGIDTKHRNEILRRDHCVCPLIEEGMMGTLREGLSRILQGLLIVANTDYNSLSDDQHEVLNTGLEGIEMIHSELIGKLIHMIDSLIKDVEPLISGELTLIEWGRYLICLFEAYFAVHDSDENERQAYESILKKLVEFQCCPQKIKEKTVSFNSIQNQLLKSLKNEVTESDKLPIESSLQFYSLQHMQQIPKKVIIILGMEEGVFPRKQMLSSLNLMPKCKQQEEYLPTINESDRYVFLESLLAARDYFILIYSSSLETGGKISTVPSLLITELLSYLDKCYQIEERFPSEVCLTKHPLYSFDPKYFKFNNRENKDVNRLPKLISYSFENYHSARAYSGVDITQTPEAFVYQSFKTLMVKPPKRIPVRIDIKHLIAAAKNPIKLYFNKVLNMYLEDTEKKIVENNESFLLSSLDTFKWRHLALSHKIPTLLSMTDVEAHFPQGAFKKMAKTQIQKEMKAIKHALALANIPEFEIYTIELNSNYTSPYLDKENKIGLVPPLKLEIKQNDEIQEVEIVGQLTEVSPGGLIVHGKNDMASLIKCWPQFLIYCIIAPQLFGTSTQQSLLLLKADKEMYKQASLNGKCEALLKLFIQHYFVCLGGPTPLIPEWTSFLLKDDVELALKKIITSLNSSYGSLYNAYIKWAYDENTLKNLEMWTKYKLQAGCTYGEIGTVFNLGGIYE